MVLLYPPECQGMRQDAASFRHWGQYLVGKVQVASCRCTGSIVTNTEKKPRFIVAYDTFGLDITAL